MITDKQRCDDDPRNTRHYVTLAEPSVPFARLHMLQTWPEGTSCRRASHCVLTLSLLLLPHLIFPVAPFNEGTERVQRELFSVFLFLFTELVDYHIASYVLIKDNSCLGKSLRYAFSICF